MERDQTSEMTMPSAMPTSDAVVTDVGQERQPIGMVREGMKVVDAAGEELGHVAFVKMGDQGTATAAADAPATQGLFDALGEVLTGEPADPDVPEPLRSQLLRTGYVKIDGKGWFDTDRYVGPEAIASVASDTVRLAITKDELVKA
jgi:hypothetical protein